MPCLVRCKPQRGLRVAPGLVYAARGSRPPSMTPEVIGTYDLARAPTQRADREPHHDFTPTICDILEIQNETSFFDAVGSRPIVQHYRGRPEKLGRHG